METNNRTDDVIAESGPGRFGRLRPPTGGPRRVARRDSCKRRRWDRGLRPPSTFLPPGTALTLPQPGRPDRRSATRRERGRLDCGVYDPALGQRRRRPIWNPVALAWESVHANLSRESATRRQPGALERRVDTSRPRGHAWQHRPHEVGLGRNQASGMWSPITVLYSPTRQRAAGRGRQATAYGRLVRVDHQLDCARMRCRATTFMPKGPTRD